ncbi:Site-specific recombinase XerD [Gemmobacter aquatilis]|uniref:Site-specific recombinase XerD n=3 Tax=Gemmobacter aquatilis TaxID=933059 RepID=A0A1H8K1B5_9RHOB|nr:Site-specific recombinase XerD [Gemmobacter aquatilis]
MVRFMSNISHLFRRGAAYSARIRVPLDLVEVIGRKELVKALGTSDLAEAKRRLHPVIANWHREFDDMRARRVLVPADREHAVWDQYTASLARDDQARAALPGEAEVQAAKAEAIARIERDDISGLDPLAVLDAGLDLMVAQRLADVSSEHRKVKLADLRQHLAKGETALIAHEVDAYLKANRLLVNRGTPEWISLARHMMRAEAEALERSLERDRGDYSGQPRDPLVKPAVGPRRSAQEVAPPGESVAEAVAAFKSENPRSVSKSRIEESCRDIGIFIETIGPDFPVAKIGKQHVRVWKALLRKYPVRATEVAAFRGMNIEQIVKANEELQRPVLSDRTVNRYLSSLSAFCAWAVDNGYMTDNPCPGMSLPKEKQSKTLPFTSEQMNTLFTSPWFAGCRSADEWRNVAKPGDVLIRDHRYWVPLIMLFSGARPGEIGQLAVNDVRQEHGHWIMHITTEGDKIAEGKSVKTGGSMRVVPIHPELIRLGFIKYHEGRVKEGGTALFPGAKRNERGQMMSDVSREFGKYLVRIGLKVGRGLSLYSFRHGAADALRRAGHLDQQFGFILGHAEPTTTGKYGIMPQGMLEQRVELVNAIAYPGLNLDHLAA